MVNTEELVVEVVFEKLVVKFFREFDAHTSFLESLHIVVLDGKILLICDGQCGFWFRCRFTCVHAGGLDLQQVVALVFILYALSLNLLVFNELFVFDVFNVCEPVCVSRQKIYSVFPQWITEKCFLPRNDFNNILLFFFLLWFWVVIILFQVFYFFT